jgi:hypothetical protein
MKNPKRDWTIGDHSSLEGKNKINNDAKFLLKMTIVHICISLKLAIITGEKKEKKHGKFILK